MLCEVCEYACFWDKSSRKPKKSTKERKKSTKSTEAGDENTPGNSTSQHSGDGEKPGGKIKTEETLANALEGKFCASSLHPLMRMISSFSVTDVTLGFVFHVL